MSDDSVDQNGHVSEAREDEIARELLGEVRDTPTTDNLQSKLIIKNEIRYKKE